MCSLLHRFMLVQKATFDVLATEPLVKISLAHKLRQNHPHPLDVHTQTHTQNHCRFAYSQVYTQYKKETHTERKFQKVKAKL